MNVRPIARAAAFAAGLLAAVPASANVDKPVELTIKDHHFHPARLEVPAGKLFTLLVHNTDGTAEHLDLTDLRLEKVIRGNSKGYISIRPLKPGEYRFVGQRHDKTARGVIVAK
ncbi:MAG: cupredoxin domain-containing protein [Thalassobaculum sp.]|uniref:cupredoxin domain-containing protein n=1 Tax=Thalassobaculum sp. TaxID=2022740 RepID=UPI0032EDF9C7